MVSINKQTCIGCGNCKATCPEVFDVKEGKAFVKKGQASSKAGCVKAAADGCPTNSIRA